MTAKLPRSVGTAKARPKLARSVGTAKAPAQRPAKAPASAQRPAKAPAKLGQPQPSPAHRATDSPQAPAKAPKRHRAPARAQPLSPPAKAPNIAAPPPLADDAPIRPVVTVAKQETLTASMKEAAKVQRTKRGAVKKGTKLPTVLVTVKKSAKEVEWQRGEYGVFMDRHSYSCIRVARGSVIEYIPMTARALDVHRASAARFEDRWKPYIYPLVSAAKIYAEGARSRGITEEARDHLGEILGVKLSNLKVLSREELTEMRKKEKAAKKATKGESVTVTTVKNGEKTVVKTDKMPTPEKAAAKVKLLSREDAAKLIKGGGKLKKGRDNDTRPGTIRSAAIGVIQACTSVDAALKAKFRWKGAQQVVKFTDVRSAVRRGYVVIAKK